MGFFNEKWKEAMQSGKYICKECGSLMEFEDENEDVLICSECGIDIDIEHYGFDSEEEYDKLYPTLEELEADEEKPYEDIYERS